MTRAQNSFFNFISGTFSTLLLVFFNFVTRSVFIRTLGESYLGVEGYYSSILSMLSLTELGFGSAIVFKLYKPLEEGDRHRIQVLMKLYRQVYRIVGTIIMGLGLCLIPFLPRLIRDYGDLTALGLDPIFIFLLYLFNTASSYWFFAYKSSLVSAAQKTYLLTVAGYAISVVSCLLQILALVLTRNFVWYLVVSIVMSVCRNLLSACICDRRFPYLKERIADKVTRQELIGFFRDCSALLLYNICDTVISGTDNIILGALVGMSAVGIYSSVYGAIKYNLRSLLYNFITSVKASVGSLYSTGNLEWSRLVFKVVHFTTAMLYGIGAVGLAVLADEFIGLWIGEGWTVTSWTANGVTVATPLALFIGIETFVTGLCYCGGTFRHAMGLFQELKYRPLASMAVNLVVCLYLVPRIGMAGCVLSTVAAELTTNLVIDPIVIHHKGLQTSARGYFVRNGLYALVTAAAGLVCWVLCGHIPLGGIGGFVVRGCVCVAVPSGLFALLFCRTAEFRFLVSTAKGLLSGRNSPSPAKKQDRGD